MLTGGPLGLDESLDAQLSIRIRGPLCELFVERVLERRIAYLLILW